MKAFKMVYIKNIFFLKFFKNGPYQSMRAQSCPTLYDPMDGGLPGSSVRGILQARKLEWVAIPFSRGSSWPRDRTRVSCLAGGFFAAEPPGPLSPLQG